MRPARLRRGLAALIVMAAATGCSLGVAPDDGAVDGPGPQQALDALIDHWQSGAFTEAAALTTDAPAAAQLLGTIDEDLRAESLTITAGPVTRDGPAHAQTTVTFDWRLPIAGSWSYDAPWEWVRRGPAEEPRWLLEFSPAVIHPQLRPHQSLVVRETESSPGVIVDRNDAQLINPVRVYSVVLLLQSITDDARTAEELAALIEPIAATITAEGIQEGIARARSDGQDSYTVVNLRADDIAPIEASLSRIEGVSLPSQMRDLPPTAGWGATVLDQALPLATERTEGEPGWRIVVIDLAGDELDTLASQPAVPGPKVTLTLDPAIQDAAQAAVDPIELPAVIVALEPGSGEILAVAQNAAATDEGPIALTGQYPPGSIFKIVTATAGLDADVIEPDTPVACPGSWSADGKTIRNQGFALGTITATEAFAHSCNTTFASLAAELPPTALPRAAAQYGIGPDFDIAGLITLTGAIQDGETVLQRAQNGFGQGTDLVTPFSAALMAATVAGGGDMPVPVLIRGTATTVDRPVPPRSEQVRTALPQMMRAVVTDGTARVLRDLGEVGAKTGTAEYVAADGTIAAHAWTIGYRADIAFAALIVSGGSSTATNELVHTFLQLLDEQQ